ncbi:BTB/POZ/MATH-domain protein [Rhynchospora pubera]|uniref:BTB/POZ/MATH-domain protein n=1 Tax=Rhynchospora pubera TaxID=906938 RepID=A0AAV8FLS2_9POAL|nr:BTB/POZ/MATH-domain protein [Rhynchospora pubera]
MAELSSVVDTETASTSITTTCTGSHLFKVIGYSLDKDIGQCITSDTFTVGGYDWNIRYYPPAGRTTTYQEDDYLDFDVSLTLTSEFSEVIRGNVTLTMLNQIGGASIRRCTVAVTMYSSRDSASFNKFIKRDQFEASQYLKNDSFTIHCTVTVKCRQLKTTHRKPRSFDVQPSNLPQQLLCLLEQGYGKDVSFNVSGVTFDAHRCMLAAKSPVFRERLFGPVLTPTKAKMKQNIEIKDMEPSVFKSMLHFIYSDSVPEFDEIKDNKDESILLAKHLLVAANRYGLERLRQLCEAKLYEFTDANNVATTLTVAVQHNCSELKAACIDFIKQPVVLADVVQSEGFEHMIKTCPTILEELRKKRNDGS